MATSSPLRYSVLALRYSALTLTLAAVVGCSNTSVNYEQDADTARTATTQWQYQQQDAVEVTQLTALIAMPELTSLVEQAILQNPSLQQTAIALQIAYAQRGVTTSGRSQYFCGNELPATACRIVLANLIRNAFQQTDSGIVIITQRQGQVVVCNVNDDIDTAVASDMSSNDLGFGLGG